jgi:hypothetical protein
MDRSSVLKGLGFTTGLALAGNALELHGLSSEAAAPAVLRVAQRQPPQPAGSHGYPAPPPLNSSTSACGHCEVMIAASYPTARLGCCTPRRGHEVSMFSPRVRVQCTRL